MIELTIRLVVSLTIVVGLLLLLARFGARRFSGTAGAVLQVVHRQALSRTSSVAVVTVGSRVLVLGTTEQQVSLLAELDPEEIAPELELDADLTGDLDTEAAPSLASLTEDATDAVEVARRAGRRTTRELPVGAVGRHVAPTATGPLAGSVLSPQTWRDAFSAATRRAS